jgi:hypothetical protein
MLISNYSKVDLGRNLMTSSCRYAASYAAAHNLLVLQRFLYFTAAAPETDQARSLDLHSCLVADVRSCLEILASSGAAGYDAVRLILQQLLEGEDVVLTRQDFAMLRLARRVNSYCAHSKDSGGSYAVDGNCWICASKRARSQQQPLDVSSLEGSLPRFVDAEDDMDSESEDFDPLSQFPVYEIPLRRTPSGVLAATSTKTRKQVRFREMVAVYETHSVSDYPARTMKAPDDPELDFGCAVAEDPSEGQGFLLSLLLGQRDANMAPNLKRFW